MSHSRAVAPLVRHSRAKQEQQAKQELLPGAAAASSTFPEQNDEIWYSFSPPFFASKDLPPFTGYFSL